MKRLARYAELAGRLTDGKTERRKDILTQDSARMRRPPRQPIGNFRLVHDVLSSMVLFEVNVPRVALTPFERDAPRTVDVQAIALRLAPERMEVKARDV